MARKISNKVFTLYVSGEMQDLTFTGDFHCTDKESGSCRYECWIEAKSLDGAGFVCNNQLIKSYFNSFDEVHHSCEQLCEIAAQQILEMLPNSTGVAVRIWGLPDEAYAEATLEA